MHTRWLTLLGNRVKRVGGYIRAGRLDDLRYALWVRWKRLDFSPVSLEQLHLDSDHSEHHVASGGVFLADVLKRLDIPDQSRVVDLGCGKGSAICTLARFPFVEVAGVELTETMAQTARENARKLRLSNVTVVVEDATDFCDLDRFTHMYVFNPFPAPVMEEVMNNLADSLETAPRRFTVIYLFPVCDEVLRTSGLFDDDVTVIDVNFRHPCYIYEHTPEALSA